MMEAVRARAWGASASAPVPSESAFSRSGGRDSELHRELGHLRALGGVTRVEDSLGWKTPVIGHFWLVVRRWLHQEIRIYQDALARQQVAFNASAARALFAIAERLDAGATRQELGELRAEVDALRDEVGALRDRLPRRGS